MQIGLFKEHHLMPYKHPTNNCPPIMPYLDVETCGQIVGMRQEGLSFQAIGQFAGVPLTTIYNTVPKYQQIGTMQTQQETGQPTILKDCDQHQLSQIITCCHCLTVAQVTNLMTESVSTRTIQQEIHKLGISTSSLSFYQPNGASNLDNGKTSAYCHGRQCPDPHSNSQQSMAPTTWDLKMQWPAHSPDQECVEDHEECHQQTLSTTNNQ
ncbi:hypothetical protein O181_001869 [Austropuccinia psidii MF-1]|uniref:Transposase IS30-like HTH domain-containing protein n=1 Tax=Austropuccinia psidii MF-1 TaxID=1389203 RepID=A0A9Q3BBD6_9BASI|nr:hypothetical protein [Austropuccinia psidii MF-1]